MRTTAAIALFALVVAGCGDDAPQTASTVTSSSSTTTSTVASTTTAGDTTAPAATSSTTSEATTTTTRPRPEGDDAPDFTVELGEGGTFTLSEEQKPVYMIFWAEW